MPFSAKINFRETAGHVTDDAGETYCLGSDFLGTDAYPVTRDGLTFGHEDSASTYTTCREGSDLGSPYSSDSNTAGAVRYNSGSYFDQFRLDLPNTGLYAIRIIGARPDVAATDAYFKLYDDTTLAYTIPTSVASHTVGNVMDMMGRQILHSDASASSGFNGAVYVHDFASTVLRLRCTADDYISYVEVIEQTLRPGLRVGPPVADRNNYGADVGYRLVPARDINVTHLGRPTDPAAGMSQNHAINLWRYPDAVHMGGCTVTPASPFINGYFVEPITPVTLLSGVEYRIASTEFVSGDSWINSSQIAGIDGSMFTGAGRCYSASPGTYPGAHTSTLNEGYVHLNLYETVSGASTALLNTRRHFR